MHFLGYSHAHDDDDFAAGALSGRFWASLGLLALAGLAVWLLSRSAFFVDETEYVYVTQFGEPLRLETEPGLRLKRPYQSLWRFDRRLQMYEPPGREMLTEDKENLDFEWYVCWRIPGPEFVAAELRRTAADADAAAASEIRSHDVKVQTENYVRRYLQTVGGAKAAEARLEERIQATIAAEIGRTRLAELASLAPGEMKL
ncbi:MAG TPA: SPFH domain-containing protein, partial [Thermomicrobiales bacterium]|nr:SPFH domain-containing protein [Thermomicrobiales bacterium]